MDRHFSKQHGEECMNNDERIKSGLKGDLEKLEVAWNHFEFCEPEYIDRAIDDLRNAEEALSGSLRRARHEKLEASISKT